ncbi:metalloendopeptidase [Saccharomycopsis crataegensis]|uniref:Metalloendopeptidase n=1 Tax=Saccharomycopsis crataegensis TaxID=43959 RepID=A0AAV5QM93_9ASCO|nr:metalloendopeptidase [Saccharomycopsis crataegensis]
MSTATNTFSYKVIAEDKEFVKSDLDDRQYRVIRLPNNLEALLIHDSTSEKAAAAIDVNVGSVHDPKNLPGLAHFCEHLLFMGTSKFPKENEYQEYLAEHSGRSNAFTASNSTNYYFEVDWKHLNGALDRFSQFFINPLFSKDGQEREINAINSEHDKNVENDIWRMHQLGKLVANPEHPHTNFSTGNLETLRVQPGKIGINPRDELLNWYKTHYSSNIMKLCIISQHSLDDLSNFAAEYFSEIEDRKVNLDQLNKESKDMSYLTSSQLSKLIKVKPVKNVKSLRFTFFVPLDEEKSFHLKPGAYISHLVGHESKGSLLYYFKITKNWATGLSSSFRMVCDRNSLFEIEVDLTDEGYQNINNIIAKVFEFINHLKTLDESDYYQVYQELVDITKIQFKFKEKSGQVMNTVSGYTHTMQSKFLKDNEKHKYLSYFYFFNKEYNFASIKEILGHLRPDNFLLYNINHSFVESDLSATDPWYGTKYSTEIIDDQLIKSLWEVGSEEAFHLPPLPNPFIPEDFKIQNEKSQKPKSRPLLVSKDSKMEIWFKKDDRFYTPKGSIAIFLQLPNAVGTPINVIMMTIFKELLNLKLNDISYQASLVGLRVEMYSTSKGYEIFISGYTDKLLVLLKQFFVDFIDLLTSDTDFNNADKFNLIKNQLIKRYKNFKHINPYSQIDSHYQILVHEDVYHSDIKLEYLVDRKTGEVIHDYVNFETFNNYLKTFLKHAYVTSLILGNFNEKLVIPSFINTIKEYFLENEKVNFRNVSAAQNLSNVSRTIKLDEGLVNRYEIDAENSNSCIFYYFQVGEVYPMLFDLQYPDSRSTATGALKQPSNDISPGKALLAFSALKSFLREPFFDQLRTKEQLGYIVFASPQISRTVYGFRVLVQSSVKSTYYLESRIKHFINNGLKDMVHNMSDEEFKKTIDSLRNSLEHSLKFKNLNEEFYAYSGKIYGGMYQFNANKLKLDNLENLTKQDIIDVFDKYILNDSTSKRLIVHLKGKNEKKLVDGSDFPANFPEGKLITNVGEFKSGFSLSASGRPLMDIEYYKSYRTNDDGDLDSKL